MDSPIPAKRAQLSPRQFTRLVRNVENWHKGADEDTRADGQLWYPRAHDIAQVVGERARIHAGLGEGKTSDVERGAGIVAALSQQTGWRDNVKLAMQMARHGSAKGHIYGDKGLPAQKARAIREGEPPEDVLDTGTAHKTLNFYRNIREPDDPAPVTVDRHAHDIAVGSGPFGEADRGLSAKGRYDIFADAYHRAAHRVGENPNVVQATTWTHWRRAHGMEKPGEGDLSGLGV